MFDGSDYYFFIVKVTAGLLAIVNPVGAIVHFIALTTGRSSSETKTIALTATIAAVVTLLIASVLGEQILRVFGISLPSFRIAGGILVLLVAISMFHAEPTLAKYRPEETQEALTKSAVAVVPMAIPFLSGPGAVTSVILFAHQCDTWGKEIALWSVIAFTGLVVYLALRLADPIRDKIGQTGANITTRVMGLILAALAVEFITKGLAETFPGWAVSMTAP